MKQIFLYTLEVLELLFRQRTCITQYVVFTLYQSSVFNIVRWALQYLVARQTQQLFKHMMACKSHMHEIPLRRGKIKLKADILQDQVTTEEKKTDQTAIINRKPVLYEQRHSKTRGNMHSHGSFWSQGF